MSTFQKLVGLSVLIASLSLTYYLTIFLPNKEQQRQARVENQTKLRSECFDRHFIRYRLEWAVKCKEEGLDELCTGLPRKVAENLGQRLEENRNYCLKLYPTN